MTSRARAWGAIALEDGRIRFRVWAPAHDRIHLRLVDRAGDLAMIMTADGWHELITDLATHGSQYWFVLPNGQTVPDPASAYQPRDVSGPSEVI